MMMVMMSKPHKNILTNLTPFLYISKIKFKLMTAQEIMFEKYGDPEAPDYDAKWTVLWDPVADGHVWWPSVKVPIYDNNVMIATRKAGPFRINIDFKPMVHNAYLALEAQNLQGEIITFDGRFLNRSIK
jgi:hypothetical protein